MNGLDASPGMYRSIQNFLLLPIQFVPAKPHEDPKNIIFGMEWTWIAETKKTSLQTVLDARLNVHDPV